MMLFRLAFRRFPRTYTAPFPRTVSSSSSRRASQLSRLTRVGLASGAALTIAVLAGNATRIHADAEQDEIKTERPPTPLSTLVRAYVVYSMCSVPILIDWSPAILSTLLSIPGVKQVTEALVRITFFDHFVGGDTAEDAIPLLEQLRAENKGCLFAYSVEVDEAEAAGKANDAKHHQQSPHKQIVAETLHCIDVAADFEDKHRQSGGVAGRKTWVAIKLTAMVPRASALIHLSKYLTSTRPELSEPVPFPGRPRSTDLDALSTRTLGDILTESDLSELRELYEDLGKICAHAQKRGVKIIVDAEHSWYQPAIDAFQLALMRQFNRLPEPRRWSLWPGAAPSTPSSVQPLVYGTYQAYLRRTPEYLAQSLDTAQKDGYALGVKLVRGAYHPHELAAHAARTSSSAPASLSISPDPLPPVWPTKPETDACYDACARLLLARVAADVRAQPPAAAPRLGVLFGTHNRTSCARILDALTAHGLARERADGTLEVADEAAERVALAQLYGMSDALTDWLVDRTRSAAPFVLKYIPYGHLTEVMPYLSRRAIENKSVLGNGGAAQERQRAWAEIRKRILG
ncbi:FAD-linked oxidoreductase [Obba rivulosa]|uniref:Proline dehydrogenase n=1 Tax=Obba rivulosa TaxID=1052685 RepID=A0A8E2J428_9APHY|nr:FAD-linked oxidoreductase [Obba rivulosa]